MSAALLPCPQETEIPLPEARLALRLSQALAGIGLPRCRETHTVKMPESPRSFQVHFDGDLRGSWKLEWDPDLYAYLLEHCACQAPEMALAKALTACARSWVGENRLQGGAQLALVAGAHPGKKCSASWAQLELGGYALRLTLSFYHRVS